MSAPRLCVPVARSLASTIHDSSASAAREAIPILWKNCTAVREALAEPPTPDSDAEVGGMKRASVVIVLALVAAIAARVAEPAHQRRARFVLALLEFSGDRLIKSLS
jgi:hypothetical protein